MTLAEHDSESVLFFCSVHTMSSDVRARGAASLPGGQLVDVTAAIFGPDDDFVCGDELPSSPGLVVVTGH